MSLPSRILAIAGPDRRGTSDSTHEGAPAAPGAGWRSNLRWLGLLLFLHLGARSFLNFPKSGDVLDEALYAASIVVAIAGLATRASRALTRIAFVLVTTQLWRSLPDSANHVFLEAVLFGLFSLLDPRDEGESELLLQGLRWYIAIFFFYTGVQKVLYGYYFDGQFLAYMAATELRFTALFQYLIPAEELARLQSFNEAELPDFRFQVATDAGPYRVDSTLFVLASNVVWIYELVAGVLLMIPRTRRFAAVTLIVFVVMIELAARELTFGLLMMGLALLFFERAWIRKLFPLLALGYGYLLLAEGGGVGILPMFWYSPA